MRGLLGIGAVVLLAASCGGESITRWSNGEPDGAAGLPGAGGGPGARGGSSSTGAVPGGGRSSTGGSGGRGGSGAGAQGGTAGSGGSAGTEAGGTAGMQAAGGIGGGPAPNDGGMPGAAGDGGQGGADDGPCPGPNGNLAVPGDYPTIQAAIDDAADGDTVLVAPGTYFERLVIAGKAVLLRSAEGPATTIIDGGDSGAVITVNNVTREGTLLEGFTIRNGNDYWGAGITLEFGGSPTIRGNWFLDNYGAIGGFGAAIGGNGASPLIDSNYFEGNWCDNQHLSGVISFVNHSSPRIVNNVIFGNDCRGINITIPEHVPTETSNNTLVDNRTGIYVGAQIPTAAQIYRNNVIVGGDIGFEVANDDNGVNGPTWLANLVFMSATNFVGVADPTGTFGNLSDSPLFVDAAVRNFRLRAGSAAIDAGTSEGPSPPPFDFDHAPRPTDGDGDGTPTIDLGAYEYGARPVCP